MGVSTPEHCTISSTLRAYGVNLDIINADSDPEELRGIEGLERRLPQAIYDAAVSCSSCDHRPESCNLGSALGVKVEWETQTYNGVGTNGPENVRVYIGGSSKLDAE